MHIWDWNGRMAYWVHGLKIIYGENTKWVQDSSTLSTRLKYTIHVKFNL